MQTRHRIPTIFTLSMVDVLCCALGCVILLWLVYFKEAKERAAAAGLSGKELQATRLRLEKVSGEFSFAQQALLTDRQKLDALQGRYAEAASQRDQLLAKWTQADKSHKSALISLKEAMTRGADLQADLRKLEAEQAALSAKLDDKMREHDRLVKQLTGATQTIRDLELAIGGQKSQLATAADQAADLKTMLKQSQADALKADQQLAALKAVSKEYGDQLSAAEARAMLLQLDLDKRKKDVADSGRRFDELLTVKQLLEQSLAATRADLAKVQKDLAETKLANHGLAGATKVLSKQVDELRLAADNRFAGIELTGKRVVFVVDMSGSMRMKDYTKEDPDKWPLLCEILGKIMQSLTDLTHFQVILFSDNVRYPLGGSGQWIEYKGVDSVKQTVKAVLAVTPEGGTNMSMVFEEAFRYRAQGMDTIYFLSDGLPNQGQGLPLNSDRMSETEKGVHLGKYIREQLKTTWNPYRGRWVGRPVRINAVGFYFDSPDVGAFLWALARDNDGGFVGLSKP